MRIFGMWMLRGAGLYCSNAWDVPEKGPGVVTAPMRWHEPQRGEWPYISPPTGRRRYCYVYIPCHGHIMVIYLYYF